jgi:hypothetical protein
VGSLCYLFQDYLNLMNFREREYNLKKLSLDKVQVSSDKV